MGRLGSNSDPRMPFRVESSPGVRLAQAGQQSLASARVTTGFGPLSKSKGPAHRPVPSSLTPRAALESGPCAGQILLA